MVSLARAGDCRLESCDLFAAGVEDGKVVGVFLRKGGQVFDRGAVLAAHRPQRKQALFAALKFVRIERAFLERLLDRSRRALDRLDRLVQRLHARLDESRRLRHPALQPPRNG